MRCVLVRLGRKWWGGRVGSTRVVTGREGGGDGGETVTPAVCGRRGGRRRGEEGGGRSRSRGGGRRGHHGDGEVALLCLSDLGLGVGVWVWVAMVNRTGAQRPIWIHQTRVLATEWPPTRRTKNGAFKII